MNGKTCIIAGMALALAGCVTQEQAAMVYGNQKPASASTRRAIIEYAKGSFFDPYSMRDVSISSELRGTKPGLFLVCIRANAKNRMGAYTGLTSTAVRFNNGRIDAANQHDPACTDPRMQWAPFPEMEKV